jgi:hypothetical protein
MRNSKDMAGRPPRISGGLPARIVPGLAMLAATVVLASPWSLGSQPSPAVSTWKTGAEFETQLNSLVGIRWAANPLRRALSTLAHHQGVAILLDRRVDPDQEIDFSAQNTELRQVLERLSEQLGLGVCQVGPVIYLAPRETTAVLATVAALREEEENALAPTTRSKLRRARPLQWPELTTPRALIEHMAGEVGLQVEGSEQIPHDLWPAVDLPPLGFAKQMSLVLAGFNLTYEYDRQGSGIRLKPLPATAVIQREHVLRGSPTRVVAEIQRRFPNARLAVNANRLVVEGTIEEHDAIRQLLAGGPVKQRPAAPPAQAQVLYTLEIQNQPVGGIATALAKRLGREVRFDPRTTEKLGQLVSFQVKEATLEELLNALFQPVGLSYRIDEQTMVVLPGPSP